MRIVERNLIKIEDNSFSRNFAFKGNREIDYKWKVIQYQKNFFF